MVAMVVHIAPQGAVRMTQRGKFIKTNAQRYLNYKKLIAVNAKQHFREPLQGAVKVRMMFYYPIPASWSRKRREEARSGNLYPVVKPDLDNVIKGVFDSLNGIAWRDDNQVVAESSSKHYAEEPRIEIIVEAI